jgi:hypothetical protein
LRLGGRGKGKGKKKKGHLRSCKKSESQPMDHPSFHCPHPKKKFLQTKRVPPSPNHRSCTKIPLRQLSSSECLGLMNPLMALEWSDITSFLLIRRERWNLLRTSLGRCGPLLGNICHIFISKRSLPDTIVPHSSHCLLYPAGHEE